MRKGANRYRTLLWGIRLIVERFDMSRDCGLETTQVFPATLASNRLSRSRRHPLRDFRTSPRFAVGWWMLERVPELALQ